MTATVAWSAANRLAYWRAYHIEHREERREKAAIARAANRENLAAAARAYRVTCKEEINHRDNARRAKRVGASGSHTLAEWQAKIARFGGRCFYCGEAKTLERDHKVPFCRGGSDDIRNVVPACDSCNSKKGRMTAYEFMRRIYPATCTHNILAPSFCSWCRW